MGKRRILLHMGVAVLAAGGAWAAQGEEGRPAASTYCNPLAIPDYPVGRNARNVVAGAPTEKGGLWLQDRQEQFRELADVSALWHEGRWYLYPSVDMAWVSADGGASWEHHPLNVRDIGYAPTIVRHRGRFLLMASDSAMYTAENPLGPFTAIGKIELPRGVPGQTDPMLFSDEDGRLYYYWGCTATNGIFAVELDAEHPTQIVGKPERMIAFEPDRHPWQRLGDWNEDPNTGWIEGAWMFKRNGVYYLTYSAAGTENRTYAMGCSLSKSPLGPFTPQKNNPILRSTEGLITGTAHGCIVEGAHHQLWAFYTVRAAVVHGFERRLGMDPAFIDAEGELHVQGPSSAPQHLPREGKGVEPTGWRALNTGVRTTGSSTGGLLSGRLAVDDNLQTWWQPSEEDRAPMLTSVLRSRSTIRSVRIVWRDIGLNTKEGVMPGPFRYRVEAQSGPDRWITVLDRSQSNDDLLVDYRECPATTATAVRLVIVGAPKGITPGVADFTVFGEVIRTGGQ